MKTSSRTLVQSKHKSAQRVHVSPVAAACSALLFTMGAAYAQQASVDAVVVTGIRGSIESSIAAKRNSDSIVEVVTAEDIGKMPDSSIADSIARLPGLSAQRIDGRPSAISIRGLGPDYAGNLINGRQVVSSGDGRSAEYDQFPSELFNSVMVYKTPDASLVGQGLSGTVDIRPLMPLDLRGRQMNVSVRGEQNSLSTLSPQGSSAMGNRVSASYVNQYGDNTVGLALGYSHLNSPGESKKYEAWNYGDYGQWGAGSGVTSLGNGNKAQFSQGATANVTSSNQVRDGLMAVLELKPNPDYHSVIDLYYSKFEQTRASNFYTADAGLWSGGGSFSNPVTSVVNGNTILSGGTVNGGRALVYEKNFQRTDDVTSIGWKNEFKLANKWTATADVGVSRANRDERYVQSVARGIAGGPFTFSGLDTVNHQNWSTAQDLSSPSNVKLTNDPDWAELRTPTYTDEIKSFKLSGRRSLDNPIFASIETGLNYSQRDKNVKAGIYKLTLASTDVAIPTSALRAPAQINVGGINTSILSWDVPSIMNLYTQEAKDPWAGKDNNYAVHEKITTAFAKLDIDSKMGVTPVRGNVGVQAVQTQQSSDGFAWNDGGGTPGATAANLKSVTGGSSYTDLLPSLNLVFMVEPDLITRLGLAKTMARPRMDDMRAGADQPHLVANAPGSAIGHWAANGGGKPDLEPWRANSFDLSVEKYFGKRSYVAAAGFYKKLDSFIYSQDTVRDFSGFTNYSTTLTPGCSAANPGCNPNVGTITTQANGHGGSVQGVELSASLEASLLSPALQGFGLLASESVTNNHLPKDVNGNPIYLDGFSSRVNNLTVYYEANGFSSRISQRYRSPFTASTRSVLQGTQSNTQFQAEKQIDLQLAYAFTSGSYKGMSLLFQVINLTDAPSVTTRGPELIGSMGSKTGQLPWTYETVGRSVLLGASYKF